MEVDLPDLPFNPRSIVSNDEDEKEEQYQDLQNNYVKIASATFDSEIERCNDIGARITGDNNMIATDNDSLELIQKAMLTIEEIHLYYGRILKRQRNLSALSKSAKRRLDLNQDISVAEQKKKATLKTLELLKLQIWDIRNKRELDKIEAENRNLKLRIEAGGSAEAPRENRSDGKYKEVPALKPDKIMKSDPANQLRKFMREFGIYFDASNFKAAGRKIQCGYIMLLIDVSLVEIMSSKGYDPDDKTEKHWVYPEQCTKNGHPRDEAIMCYLEQAWSETHPIHLNRCQLFNIRQMEGESYAQLLQRIQDTWKECEMAGLLTKNALEGHIIFNALGNTEHKWEILRKNKLKVNLERADIDIVCKIEAAISHLTDASSNIFDSGRLGPPIPSNSLKKVGHPPTERRGSNSSRGSSSSGYGFSSGRFSHLKGQEKFDAIKDEQGTCFRCLKRHSGMCDVERRKIKCPTCGKGFHSAEACCYVEGETLRHRPTRRGSSSSSGGRGTKRRFESPSRGHRPE